ncbi:MAG: family 10 glycosylhydrolase [Ruminococcus sp.]|nr:family 10 glycosylhydrolase [Ruminococcus sp.]
MQSGSNWWLNPAYPEVRQLIVDGVAEIVSQYDVDGVHLDDYFYPTTDPAFDAAAFAESGADDLLTFRLAQTSRMVQLIYDTVKAQDQSLIVSISPQGTMRGNYDSQYADVQLWASETGYCDVLIPQIYYGFKNENAPFEDTVAIWTQTVTSDCVSLVVWICTYKLGCEDTWAGTGSTEWVGHLDIPQRQVEFLLQLDGVDGIAIYDYDTTFEPETAVNAMAKQVDAITGLLRGTGTT